MSHHPVEAVKGLTHVHRLTVTVDPQRRLGENIASSAPDRKHDAAAKFQLNLDQVGATTAKTDLARINEPKNRS